MKARGNLSLEPHLQPNRQERRAGSRRERARAVKSKADKLYDLVKEGRSEQAIAATLGYSLEDTRFLLALVEKGRGEGSR